MKFIFVTLDPTGSWWVYPKCCYCFITVCKQWKIYNSLFFVAPCRLHTPPMESLRCWTVSANNYEFCNSQNNILNKGNIILLTFFNLLGARGVEGDNNSFYLYKLYKKAVVYSCYTQYELFYVPSGLLEGLLKYRWFISMRFISYCFIHTMLTTF